MRKGLMCIVLLFGLSVGGCESVALVAGGAAGGHTISHALEKQQQVIRDDIAKMEAQKTALEVELAEATDEAERERIQQQIKNTDTVLADLKDADILLTEAQTGLGTDWGSPPAVMAYLSNLAIVGWGIWQRRKKNQATTALTEVVAGGEEFKRISATPGAIADFKTAMTKKQKTSETRELVAVIKA